MGFEEEDLYDQEISNAFRLTKEAEDSALYQYTNLYSQGENLCTRPECLILEESFLQLINDVCHLTQQDVEGRSIKTKILIPYTYWKLYNWPNSVFFSPVKESPTFRIDLEYLKKYIEIGGDSSTFLVIDIDETSVPAKSNSRFIMKGFLFVYESLESLLIEMRTKLMHKTKNYKELLGPLYKSIIMRIQNKKVIASYLDIDFLVIEKGKLTLIPSLEVETNNILLTSESFFNSLFPREKDTFDDENNEKKEFIKIILRDIILKISDAKHGSTLIFGYKGTLDNKSSFQPNPIKVQIPLGDAILQILLSDKRQISVKLSEINELIKVYKNAIISLSKTDGALIFNDSLNLMSAGTFLKVKKDAIGPGGARRKSAESFVNQQKDTLAIVISQDGTITMMNTDNKTRNI